MCRQLTVVVLATLLTVVLFWAFGIQEGHLIQDLVKMMPALEDLSAPILLGVFGPTILAAAVASSRKRSTFAPTATPCPSGGNFL